MLRTAPVAARTYGLILAATMLFAVLANVPIALADSCNDGSDLGSPCYRADVTGPGSLTLKTDVLRLSLGLGVCVVDSSLPLACYSAPGLAGAGAVFFNVSDFTNTATHEVTAWAELDSASTCGPLTTCGFDMLLCADRDDSTLCTNANANDDMFRASASTDPTLCDSDLDPKDTKSVCDGHDASVTACVRRDLTDLEDPVLLPGGNWDDLVVFIGNWVGASTGQLGDLGFPQNLGAGVAIGTWHVSLEDHGDNCDAGGGDADSDGIPDAADNCPNVANADQADFDEDGKGDACDADKDNDGVANGVDNCPSAWNREQENNDGDAFGDACDSDDDNDGIADGAENCPKVANPGQADANGDGVGDACDPKAPANPADLDKDGVANAADNCHLVWNPDQKDYDADGIGDACDPDDDNDGIPDATDNCPKHPNRMQQDSDGDGVGDACDQDPDNDGVLG